MIVEFIGICCWTYQHTQYGTKVIIPEGSLGAGESIPQHNAMLMFDPADVTVSGPGFSAGSKRSIFVIEPGTSGAFTGGTAGVVFNDFPLLPRITGTANPACMCNNTVPPFVTGVTSVAANLVAAVFDVTSGTVEIDTGSDDTRFTRLTTDDTVLTLTRGTDVHTFTAAGPGSTLTIANVSADSIRGKHRATAPPHSGLFCKLLQGPPPSNLNHHEILAQTSASAAPLRGPGPQPQAGHGPGGKPPIPPVKVGPISVGIACSNHGYP